MGSCPMFAIEIGDQVLQPLLAQLTVDERHLLRQLHVEEHPPDRGLEQHALDLDHVRMQHVLAAPWATRSINCPGEPQLDGGLGAHHARVVGQEDLLGRGKGLAAALSPCSFSVVR